MNGPSAKRPDADAVVQAIAFNERGLVPAIAQDVRTGVVLMMAWMNEEAVRETLGTGRVCYWSRSRGQLWRKGESSGNTQNLREMRVDCDGDTLLLLVEQKGPACHTGAPNCFFRAAGPDGLSAAKPRAQPWVKR
ncbi:MAG: phosphoribosyl-AMP cyclohydrolase [Alphaproteobacteria bacterium]